MCDHVVWSVGNLGTNISPPQQSQKFRNDSKKGRNSLRNLVVLEFGRRSTMWSVGSSETEKQSQKFQKL